MQVQVLILEQTNTSLSSSGFKKKKKKGYNFLILMYALIKTFNSTCSIKLRLGNSLKQHGNYPTDTHHRYNIKVLSHC